MPHPPRHRPPRRRERRRLGHGRAKRVRHAALSARSSRTPRRWATVARTSAAEFFNGIEGSVRCSCVGARMIVI
jgi:hypothetical protein